MIKKNIVFMRKSKIPGSPDWKCVSEQRKTADEFISDECGDLQPGKELFSWRTLFSYVRIGSRTGRYHYAVQKIHTTEEMRAVLQKIISMNYQHFTEDSWGKKG